MRRSFPSKKVRNKRVRTVENFVRAPGNYRAQLGVCLLYIKRVAPLEKVFFFTHLVFSYYPLHLVLSSLGTAEPIRFFIRITDRVYFVQSCRGNEAAERVPSSSPLLTSHAQKKDKCVAFHFRAFSKASRTESVRASKKSAHDSVRRLERGHRVKEAVRNSRSGSNFRRLVEESGGHRD